MQNFKQYLQEAKTDFAPWHITDKEILEKIIDSSYQYSKSLSILKNGSVRVKTNDLNFVWAKYLAKKVNLPIEKLPFKITTAKGHVTINGNYIDDIWGAPDKCEILKLSLPEIKSLQHLNGTYSRGLSLDCGKLEEFNCSVNTPYIFFYCSPAKFDFKDFIKSFPQCTMVRFLFTLKSLFVNMPLLSFYKHKIDINVNSRHSGNQSDPDFEKGINLFNLYKEHLEKNTSLLEFQDILLENDYKIQARF